MNRYLIPAITAIAVGTLTLSGCSPDATTPSATTTSPTSSSDSTVAAGPQSASTVELDPELTSFLADNVTSHAQTDDADYDPAFATSVTLGDDDVSITEPGTYILSGTLTDATLTVDSTAEGKVRLVLNGATLNSSQGSPLVIAAADEVVLIMAAGTTNTITDSYPHPDSSDSDEPDAAVFSMADLTIGGTGALQVTSSNADAVASKDGLVVLSGTLDLTAADDGLRGQDYVLIEGGKINVQAGADAIKSTNETDDTVGFLAINGGTISLAAGDDALHAEGDLAITGGQIDVTASVEGIEGANIVIAGGQTSIVSSDDGVNATTGASAGTQPAPGQGAGPGAGASPGSGGAAGAMDADDGSQLIISGGTLSMEVAGDGLDSNGTITMTGGEVSVAGPTRNDNGAIDSSSFDISGGTLVAAGSSGMVVTPSSDGQGWMAINLAVDAGQTVEIASGTASLLSHTLTMPATSIIVSTPGMTNGETYQVSVDSASVSAVTAGQGPLAGSGGTPPR